MASWVPSLNIIIIVIVIVNLLSNLPSFEFQSQSQGMPNEVRKTFDIIEPLPKNDP